MFRAPFSKDDTYMPIREPRTFPQQSTLSVDAPEFVYNPQQPMHQYQQPLNEPEQQQQQQQQQQQHHQQQQQQQQPSYGPPYNGYNHVNQYQQLNQHSHQFIPHNHSHHHHQQYQNHHHQQQQQQQHLSNQQNYQQQHQSHHNHRQNPNPRSYVHSQQQRMGALTNEFQDHLKISNTSGNNRPVLQNYSTQAGNYRRTISSFPSQQSRLKCHNEPSTSKEAASSDYASKTPDMETVALDYLSSVIQCLNSNPGQYDTIATRFVTIFDGLENNLNVLSIAMEDIFNESTQNPNFRYMGAKLYYLLHMFNLKKDSLFLTLLKCKLDDFKREVCKDMGQSKYDKVRESTLFLAELYMQLRGDDSRINLLAESIVFSLKLLLDSESSDNVRCICMTLKLAGYDLTSDCPEEIAEIISSLHNINEKCPGKYPIIASVLALSKENWGRKLSTSTSLSESEPSIPEPPRSSDEPIFYGPDGRELTAEETDFLTGGLVSGPAGSTDDDDDADLDEFDPEMDEEASRAYKAFCKQNASS